MMTFVNTHSKGLTILPTHRLVRNVANFNFEKFRNSVARYFDWYSYPFQDAEERASAYADFRKDLESENHGRRAIGVYPRRRRRSIFFCCGAMPIWKRCCRIFRKRSADWTWSCCTG